MSQEDAIALLQKSKQDNLWVGIQAYALQSIAASLIDLVGLKEEKSSHD